MINKAVHSLLTPGRIVLLQHPATGLSELAVVVGSPDTRAQILAAADSGRGGYGGARKGSGGIGLGGSSSSAGSGFSGSGVGPDRVLWFLVLHQPGPLDPPAAVDDGAAAAAAAQIGEVLWWK